MLLIITSTGYDLRKGIDIDDLERPLTSKISCFRDSLRFWAAIHFKSELHRNGWR